jgi:hypothetical protein
VHSTEISYLSYSCALALDQSLDRLTPRSSPSEIVHSPDKVASLLGDKSPIHLNGPPAAIFNPALAGLQRNLENLEEVKVSRNDVDCAAKYLRCAVDFYKDEAQRQKAIMDLINEAIGQNGEWGYALDWADGIKPDGCWWHDLFLVQILELKNTLGLSGDALLQAIADYSKIVAREKVRSPIPVPSNPIAYLGLQYKPFRGYSNFPIVLVGATANRLEICIAVCVGPIYVSKLLALDLSLGFHASDNIVRLARVFQALSLCCKHLQMYYDGVSNSAPPKLSCLYPNPTPADLSNPPPSLSTSNFCREPVNRLQLLWTSGTQPPPCTLPPSTPARKSLSSLPPVITKRHIACLPTISLPRNSTSVNVSLATCTWSLWTVWTGSPFGSSKWKERQFLRLSWRRSRKQCISFMKTISSLGTCGTPIFSMHCR